VCAPAPAALAVAAPDKLPKDASAAKAAGAPVQLNFKRLTSLEPAAMGKTLSNTSSPGPAGGMLSYSTLAQLAGSQPAAAAAAAAATQQVAQLAQLQALLQQQAPAADTLNLLQAAQMARMANVNSTQLGQQLALASALASRSDLAWKGQMMFK